MRIRGPIFQALTLIAFFTMVTVSDFVRSDIETTVTYYHSNFSGSPVAATSQIGAVLWTSDYVPYGKRYNTTQGADNSVWFTGHVEDDPAGLVYMEARYYDPDIGRFHGIDSVGFVESNPMSFNRYAYANNNPYKYSDPDGRSPILVPIALLGLGLIGGAIAVNSGGWSTSLPAHPGGLSSTGGQPSIDPTSLNSSGGRQALDWSLPNWMSSDSSNGNTNPYDGPVDNPVTVVDGDGNAIPIGAGEQIGASSNGDYQQVKDRAGKPTGVRLDRGGHRGHTDPKARAPHGHRPGVSDETGNPHLPINSRK